MAQVYFHRLDTKFRVQDIGGIKRVISQIFNAEGITAGRIDVFLCSDTYLLGLNQEYLSHDYYTDILTFQLNEKGTPVTGEMYISTERVKDNAGKFGVRLGHEIRRVIIHGILHLCGFKDQSTPDKKVMQQKEDEYLLQFR